MRSQTVTTLTHESIAKHRNWCIARGQSQNTAKAYSSDLREFLKASGETAIPMEDFEELAMGWLNMTREKVAPKTTGRRLTSLRNFSKWAGYPGLLEDYVAPTPAKGVPHPIPEGVAGLERMAMKAINSEQRALIGLCGFAGLRIHEALACTPDWFDLHTMRLTVRGKGDKTRVVPISTRAWAAVQDAYIKAQIAGTPLVNYKDRSARKAVTSMGHKARLSRPVASHDLRATFATAAYDHTLDQRVVQELLGHASGTQTELYIGVSMNNMIKAVEF